MYCFRLLLEGKLKRSQLPSPGKMYRQAATSAKTEKSRYGKIESSLKQSAVT